MRLGVPLPNRQEIVDAICARLSNGEPMTNICRDLGPTMGFALRTVNVWRHEDMEVRQAFDDARDLGFDMIAHGSRQTARGRGDSTDDVQRDKLIIDTDFKLLAKWDPRRYGDKTIIAGDKENPVQFESKHAMTDAALLAIASAALKDKPYG